LPFISALIARPWVAATFPSSCLVRYELIAAVVSAPITRLITATSTTIAAATRTLNDRAATLMPPACAASPQPSSTFPGTLL
jgi:hypothetical protein